MNYALLCDTHKLKHLHVYTRILRHFIQFCVIAGRLHNAHMFGINNGMTQESCVDVQVLKFVCTQITSFTRLFHFHL